MAVPPTSSTTSLFNLADIFLCLILHVNNVEGKQNEELNMNLLVEIKSATDESKTENVFPLPLSNFFQVKGLSRGKHLVQLKSNRPLGSHKVVSEIIEVDFETNAQIHVGPLRYSIVADHQSQVSYIIYTVFHIFNFHIPIVWGLFWFPFSLYWVSRSDACSYIATGYWHCGNCSVHQHPQVII